MESYAYRGKVQKGTLWCLEEGSYPHKPSTGICGVQSWGTYKESSLVLASNQHKAGLSYFTWELTKPFMVTHEEDFSEAWCSLHMDHNFLNKEISRD